MNPFRSLALVALAAGIAAAAGCKGRPKPAPDVGPPKVTVAYPKADKVLQFTDLTGSVFAPQSVQVRPRVSGFIKAVPLIDQHREGQMVKKGDVLFEIDPVTYDADLKQALAQVEVSKAKLDLAEKDEARTKLAYDKGVTSKQDFDTYVAKSAVARAELEAANSPVIKARQNLEWTKVVAPIDGKVDKAYLTPGNVVVGGETQGTVLTSIVSTDPMYVYFDVDDQTVSFYQRLVNEGKLKPVSKGGPAVRVDIKLLGEKDYTNHGQMDFGGNQLNPSTGTLAVRGVFPNPKGFLIPGRYVRGRVPLGEPIDALLIPDDAVVTDQGGKVVYVVTAENKVEAKPVKLGPLTRGLRVVESGLAPTDRVIVRGLQRVQPGQPVEPESGTIDYPPPGALP